MTRLLFGILLIVWIVCAICNFAFLRLCDAPWWGVLALTILGPIGTAFMLFAFALSWFTWTFLP